MLGLLLFLAGLGMIVYMIETSFPMSSQVRRIWRGVVVICLVLWLMELFGIADLPIPRLGVNP